MKSKLIRVIPVLLITLILLTTAGCTSILRKVFEAVGDDVGSKLSEEQAGKMAFGAVLSTRNDMNYTTMFGLTDVYVEAMGQEIENSWDITDHASAVETLDWLLEEGHRISLSDEYFGYDEIYYIITGKIPVEDAVLELFAIEREGYEAICNGLINNYGYTQTELEGVATVAAWDYDRLVTVSRWCAGLGYITEEEAWQYIDAVAAMAREDYDSWRTYFAGVLFGRSIWAEDGSFAKNDQDIARLLLKDDKSIYQKASFK